MPIYCGVSDSDGVSPFYKVFITQNIKHAGQVTVAGYIGSEVRIELNQLWNSPFEGDTAGNAGSIQKSAQIGQAFSDQTTKTLWNSKMVYDGTEAIEFSLQIELVAESDAKREVNDPIMYLMMMSSPNENETLPNLQRPQPVIMDLGRKIKADVLIKNVGFDEHAPKTTEGYYVSNTVTLQCSMDGALDGARIPKIFL